MRRATRGALGAIALGATVLVAPVVAAGPALAHANCGRTVSDRDSSSWPTGAADANLRQGSSTGCDSNGISYPSHRLDYHCYTWGNDGYSWTFLRNDNTGRQGWTRDDLLPGYGSTVYCGF